MAIEILDTYLTSSLASGGTITFSYPSGRTAASYLPVDEVLMIPAAGRTIDDPVVTYGSSTITVPYTGATLAANTRIRLQVTVRDVSDDEQVDAATFGIVADGVTDDTESFLAALAALRVSGGVLSLPAGTINLSSLTTKVSLFSNLRIVGAGMDLTKIRWPGTDELFWNSFADPTISNVEFADFSVIGQWLTNQTDGGKYPFLIYKVDDLRFHRVGVDYSRVMAIAVRSGVNVEVNGCRIRYCARDGINVGGCSYVRVINNHVEQCDDDGIVVNADAGTGLKDQTATITGNVLIDTQGMYVTNYNFLTITGNTMDRLRLRGISVNADYAMPVAYTITGNTITNVFNRNSIDGLSNGAEYIAISAPTSIDDLAVAPGENTTSGGTVSAIYPYLRETDDGTGDYDGGGAYWINVSGNTLGRTLETGVAYSAYGYGEMYFRSGYEDPTMTDAILTAGYGIRVSNTLKNAIFANNHIFGLTTGRGITFTGANTRCLNVDFRGNIIFDCIAPVVFNSDVNTSQDITFDGNTFDADPFVKDANRDGVNDDGSWLADGAPTGMLLQNATGIKVYRNKFRNMCRVIDVSTGIDIADNILHCEPVATFTGFGQANRGIGNLPSSTEGFWYVIEDSNPSSATWQRVLNVCPRDATAQPSTGIWRAGMFVRNRTPAIATGKVIIGWVRLTSGSAHVANTDWAALYCTNS